jgi:hypothetical protein
MLLAHLQKQRRKDQGAYVIGQLFSGQAVAERMRKLVCPNRVYNGTQKLPGVHIHFRSV